MKSIARRPLSIWVTQIVLFLTFVSFLPSLTGLLIVDLSRKIGEPLTAVLYLLLMGILPLAAFIALAKRARAGRELAIVSLLCLWSYFIGSLSFATFGAVG